MADRDPNAIHSEGWIGDKKTDYEGLKIPPGVDEALVGKEFYGYQRTYKNGRRVIEWYKRGPGAGILSSVTGAKPPADEILTTTEDVATGVKDTWDEDEAKPPATRVINGVPHQVTGKDANGQDVWSPVQTTTGPATATTAGSKPPVPPGGSSATEGTPDPSKPDGWDNNRPRQVIKDKDGKIVWAEELTGADLTAWRNNQQAGQPQTADQEDPIKDRPGWTQITRVVAQNGNKTTKVTFRGPDGQEVATLPEKPAEPKTTLTTINGQPGYRTVITPQGSGKPDKVEYFDPTGKAIPSLPAEAGTKKEPVPNKPGIVKVTKGSGNDTEIYYEDAQGNRVPTPTDPSGLAPADAPKPSGKLGEAAADLVALDQWLEPQVRSGKIAPDQADKIRMARRAYWETATKEQEAVVNAQVSIRGQEITQRGQMLSDIGNRRSSAAGIANQASGDWMGYADKFGSAPTSSLAAAIRASRVNAQDFVTMSGGNRNVDEVQQGPAMAAVNGMQIPGGPTMGPGFNSRPNTVGTAPVAPVPAAAPPDAPPPAAVPQPVTGPDGITRSPDGTPYVQGAMPKDGHAYPDPSWFTANGMQPATPEPAATPQAMAAPPPHFLAASSRGHAYDPTPSIRAMIADPRYDNETLRAVVAEEYPGYDVDALLKGAA